MFARSLLRASAPAARTSRLQLQQMQRRNIWVAPGDHKRHSDPSMAWFAVITTWGAATVGLGWLVSPGSEWGRQHQWDAPIRTEQPRWLWEAADSL